jgi:hypothetical protein
MNISKTWHSDITRLPRTAVDLARVIKAAQPSGKGHSLGRASSYGSSTAQNRQTLTYAFEGKKVILREKLTGALVNIRA